MVQSSRTIVARNPLGHVLGLARLVAVHQLCVGIEVVVWCSAMVGDYGLGNLFQSACSLVGVEARGVALPCGVVACA